MSLKLQFLTLGYNFIFGVAFSFLFSLCSKLIYNKRKLISFISIVFFVFFNVSIYFFLLKNINDGLLHFYFLLFFLGGVCFETN